jgi:hypothetical protein
MSKFYGNKKIQEEEVGEERVTLYFGGEDKAVLSRKMYDLSCTKKPTDLTTLWDKQVGAAVNDTLKVLLGWDLQMGQLDYFYNMLKSSLEHNLDKANAVLWKKPGRERTMSDVDSVLKSKDGGEQ